MALSANFALYGDLSDRMMSLAAGLGPGQEIYSIDESFIDLTGVRGDLVERCFKIRDRILQWVGIPCGIGIGPTKTLAKLANHIAKTAERKPGSYPGHHAQVCSLGHLAPDARDALLQATEVGEVWGVGRRIGAQLKEASVHTVLDLARLDPAMVKRRWRAVAASETLAVSAIVVDAKSVQAAAFYKHFGFIELPGQPGRWLLQRSRFAPPAS